MHYHSIYIKAGIIFQLLFITGIILNNYYFIKAKIIMGENLIMVVI